MSVRRLAEDSVQPPSFAFSAENASWAEATIRKYPEGRQQSAVIPLLMRAQEQEGWVSRAAIEFVAEKLDMPFIRVLEVATFYTQFQLKPVGKRAHIQVCGTTPCMLRGAEDLISVCKKKIHHDPFELNAEGTLSWEEVECLGACVNAPMVMIFKDTYEDLSPIQLEHIIDRFGSGKGHEISVGPQIDRAYSAPAGGLTALTEEIVPPPRAAAPAPAPVEATPAAPAAAAAVPPSNAAKPVTAAAETDPTLKTPATDKPAAEANAKQVGENADTAGDGEPGASLDDADRPEGVTRPEKPDDLQMIAGVGPKTEAVLNEIGIYTFAQVAAWNEAERHWVDRFLKFRGRIDREDWVRQADALARGGEEEYVRVFGRKPR